MFGLDISMLVGTKPLIIFADETYSRDSFLISFSSAVSISSALDILVQLILCVPV